MQRRFVLIMLIVSTVPLGAACSLVRVGPAVDIIDLSDGTNAEKNLDAVRAMQRDLPHRPGAAVEPLTQSSVKPVSSGEPRSSSSTEDTARFQMAPALPSSVAPATPNTEGKTMPQRTPPPVSRPSLPDRPVPAYTIPAPAGPHDSGSARCVPDGLGGQRCLRP